MQYWGVEAGLHSRLDVKAQENKSRMSLRKTALVLAVLIQHEIGSTWIDPQSNRCDFGTGTQRVTWY